MLNDRPRCWIARDYLFFGLASVLEGFAKTEDADDTAGPVPFFAAAFLGFLISRLDLFWPLAISVSFNAVQFITRPLPDIGALLPWVRFPWQRARTDSMIV